MDLPEKMYSNTSFMLSRVTRMVQISLEKELASFDLTRGQWLFLAHLYFVEGCNQQELSELLDIGKVALGKVAARLEEKGWVRRDTRDDDGRSVRLTLTDIARPLVKTLVELLFEESNRSLAGFSLDEIQTLDNYLQRIEHNLVHEPASNNWQKSKKALQKEIIKLGI